ncbi:tRNA-splicing endonuclease subunit sen54 [Rhodotorula toruloides]|uniref:tRNA-splicing endonuclease subunit sen54 n=1 Tax=Rhodotorula toruloides TaxID=5286 RepID=A0A511KK55_RHOTO|nr:tRNA-splicing endonuclease subunit sen54 [Rhodotorula toruloides]
MEDDRPTAARIDQEEADEDALPDWSRFAAFAKAKGDNSEGGVFVPFIPKRGEKDFEPLPASDAFPPSSKEATLSEHQKNLLQDSRNALYTALSSGSRHHSSRGHNSFTWRPELDGGRATCDAGNAAYGIHFGNIGFFHQKRRQLELLPEEALYMVERGAVELWREGAEGSKVPMSVQQAWDELIGRDELTPERYQVYAFLRRLGYVVVRARPVVGAERPTSIQAAPAYRHFVDCLARPILSIRHLVFRLVSSIRTALLRSPTTAKCIRLIVTRAVGGQEGKQASLVAGRRWTTYDQIFSRLAIIPSGHDRPLPRGPLPHTPSVFTPLSSIPDICKPKHLPPLDEYPYQPFFHVYKPVTKYKKSSPPEPDFKMVVINGATTPMPDLFEFTAIFGSAPCPPEPSTAPGPGAGPSVLAQAASSPARSPSKNARPPRENTTPPPAPQRGIQRLLSSIPLVPRLFPSLAPPPPAIPRRGPKIPSPYPRLKTGRRTILVAVVDNGTSSLLRFSEGEFAKIPWAGAGRKM